MEPLLKPYPHLAFVFLDVKEKAEKGLKATPGDMSLEQAMAVTMYTHEDLAHSEDSTYFLLNKALRSEKREEVKPWIGYMFLLLQCYGRLQSLEPGRKVFRGMPKANEHKPGDKITWWGFSSTTDSMEALADFAGVEGARTVYQVEVAWAKQAIDVKDPGNGCC